MNFILSSLFITHYNEFNLLLFSTISDGFNIKCSSKEAVERLKKLYSTNSDGILRALQVKQ